MRVGTIAGGFKADGNWIIDERTVTIQPACINGATLSILKMKPGILNVHLEIPAEELSYAARVKIPERFVGGELNFFVAWDGPEHWRIGIEGIQVFTTFRDEHVSDG
jgi:hypothetical protein